MTVDPDDVETELLMTKDEQIQELQLKVKHAVRFALVLGSIALVSMGLVVGIIINFSIANETPDDLDGPLICGDTPKELKRSKNLLGEPLHPGVFHSLTVQEIFKVREFLNDELNLTNPGDVTLGDAHIYMMDLELPNKVDVVKYLDDGGAKPDRYARVILFRGDLYPPVVQEQLCGPLRGNISGCVIDNTVPFSQRPIEGREYSIWEEHLIKEIHRLFGEIITESYGGSVDHDKCKDDCLNFMIVPIGSNIYQHATFKRKVWLLPVYDIPYHGLFPLDMGFLCDVDGVNETTFSVEKVWYSGILYESPESFIDNYTHVTTTPKTKIAYPTKREARFGSLRSTISKQEAETKPRPLRPPQLIEPDGKRYTIRHKKVVYMDMWSFYYRISPIYGPAIYDVKYMGVRMAYEISLMELVVDYSGFDPMKRMGTILSTAWLLGAGSKALVPGADCPTSATFLPLTVTSQTRLQPAVFPRAACIFEQNLGQPLRRHHSYSKDQGAFYGGMLDSALVVRSIHTVDNYDYVVDFKFHQNGALGVTVHTTGYIVAEFYSDDSDNPYGFQLQKNILGSIHMHSANFKVDLDINDGTSNRYQTLGIGMETVDLRMSQSGNPNITQTRITPEEKSTENVALYKFDADKPTYHIFYNNDIEDKYGNKKAYRLHSSDMGTLLLEEGTGNEPAFSWARNQISITKHNDTEPRSSSPYNQWSTRSPVVDFSGFINNESIIDQDLVIWVTLTKHSIPYSEDLPNVATPGSDMSFYLQPFNYFPEDPSMKSPDSVFISHPDQDDPNKGLVFNHYSSGDFKGEEDEGTCLYKPKNYYTSDYAWNPNSLFETTYNKGVY